MKRDPRFCPDYCEDLKRRDGVLGHCPNQWCGFRQPHEVPKESWLSENSEAIFAYCLCFSPFIVFAIGGAGGGLIILLREWLT